MTSFRARSHPNLVSVEQNDGFEVIKKELKRFKILNDRRFWKLMQSENKRRGVVCDCSDCETFKYFEENHVPFSCPDTNSPWFEAWNFHNRRKYEEIPECEIASKKIKNT
jgi:hypothetical protein